MRYPLDELLDKRSIIQLKIERIHDETDRERLSREFNDYSQAIGDYINERICNERETESWHQELYAVNGKIWDLESDIRKGKEGELGLEEVGRRALEIRDLNGIRVGIKSKVVEKVGIGYKDIKINHPSEATYLAYRTKP